MQEIRFLASVTFKAAVRMRFVFAISLILIVSVVLLPFLIKHNGTARMFSQVLLTYSLSIMTALIAAGTLWLGCAAMANDFEAGQLQMLAVKPVARWQIWLGKWTGIMLVQTIVLAIAGASAFAVLHWHAGKLHPGEQERLRQEVLVARGSLRETPPDLTRDTEKLAERRKKQVDLATVSPELIQRQVASEVKALHETVTPNYRRYWTLDLGWRKEMLRDVPMALRVHFYAAQKAEDGIYRTVWIVGDERSAGAFRQEMPLTAGTTHEFVIPANLADADGKLTVICENRSPATLLFRLEDGLELLFREGSFGANYTRGLIVIWCWMALIAAMGVTAGTFLSFPVATLLVVSLFLAGLSGETFSEVVREGTVAALDHETGKTDGSMFDWLFVPMSKIFTLLIAPVERVSPIAALSSGRSIPWEQVAVAVGQVGLLFGGIVALIGMIIFTRREISRAS